MMTALYAEIMHKSILYHYGLVTVKIGSTVFSIVFAAIDLFFSSEHTWCIFAFDIS